MENGDWRIIAQINALEKVLKDGKATNPFALKNKIKKLKEKLGRAGWENHLAR